MKILWVVTLFIAFSAEVRVEASSYGNSRVLSCEDSWISEGKLTSGCHWILDAEQSRIRTVYGDILVRNGDFTVELVDGKVFVVNHLGELRIALKDGQTVDVPQGFEIWFSEVDSNKKNKIGLLRPVEMKSHLKLLSTLWDEKPEALKKQVEIYKTRWGDRAEKAAQFCQGLVERKIAAVQAKEDAIEQKRLSLIKQRKNNQKILFDRVFGR